MGVQWRLPRVAVVLVLAFTLLVALAVMMALIRRGSHLPLLVTVASDSSGVHVRIENPSPRSVIFFFLTDRDSEWRPSPRLPVDPIQANGVWEKTYLGPAESGRYRLKIGYWPQRTQTERTVQKFFRLFNPGVRSTKTRYVWSNEFEVKKGPIAGFREQPQRADAFSGDFIHRAEEKHDLRKVFSGFGPIEPEPRAIPAYAQPLHIIFPGESDLPYLISCLSDPSPYVREQAAAALGMFSVTAEEAIPALTRVVESDPEEAVRQRAKEALYNIKGYDPGWIPEVQIKK